MSSERREVMARRHVDQGRAIVERQRTLIALIRANGKDADEAEGLLRQFEASLDTFEGDLADIVKRNSN